MAFRGDLPILGTGLDHGHGMIDVLTNQLFMFLSTFTLDALVREMAFIYERVIYASLSLHT